MSLKDLGKGRLAAGTTTGPEKFFQGHKEFLAKGAAIFSLENGILTFIKSVSVDEFRDLFPKMVENAYAYENNFKSARYVLDAAKVRADAAEQAARDANNNAGIPAARAIYNAALETYKQQVAASYRLPGFLATQKVVIPLDVYHFSDEEAINFVADTARYVRHLVNAASYEPLAPRLAPHEVLDMYVSALSGMLLDLQETGLTKTTADVITTFYRAVKSLLTGSHPEAVIAQKNAAALTKMPSTSNSLEKFLVSDSMDLSTLLHIFGKVVERSLRYVDATFAYGKGADAMFASVAALSKGSTSSEAFLAEYMRITTARDLALGDLSSGTPNRMAKSLVAVLTASGLPQLAPLSPETLEAAMTQLVAHLETSPKARIPWAMWFDTLPGLRAFTYITGQFVVDTKSGIKSNEAQSMETSSTTVTFTPPPSDATGKYVGVQIPTRPSSGQSLVLTCTVESLGGNATEATGVKGAGGTNLRLTTGNACIDSERPGFASSGKMSGKMSGKGTFVDSPMGPMNLKKPITACVCTGSTGTIAIISNDDKTYGSLVVTAESPLFLAFQQAIVTITGTHQAISTLPADVQSYLHTAASAASKAASTAASAASTAASAASTAASNSSSSSNASCSPPTPSPSPPSTEREIGRLEAMIQLLKVKVADLTSLTQDRPHGSGLDRERILTAKKANLSLLATAQSELVTAQKALAALTSAPAKPASPSLAELEIAALKAQLALAEAKAAAAVSAPSAAATAATTVSAPSAKAVTWGQQILELLLKPGSTTMKGTIILLIEGGADLTLRCPDGRTALHLASSKGHEDVIRALLDKGADPTAETLGGKTCHAILTASQNPRHKALAATLVKEKLISA